MAPVGTELPMRTVLGVGQSLGASRSEGPICSLHTDLAQESQSLTAQRGCEVDGEKESHIFLVES